MKITHWHKRAADATSKEQTKDDKKLGSHFDLLKESNHLKYFKTKESSK